MAGYFWLSIAGLMLGIAGAELYPLGFLLPLAFCASGALFFIPPRVRVRLAALVLIATGIGALRVYVADMRAASPLDSMIGQKVSITGRVADEPDARATSVLLTIAPESAALNGATTTLAHPPRILVPVRLPADFSYGDAVHIEGTLKKPQPFAGTNGREFDYPGYLAANGIAFEMPFSNIRRIAPGGLNIHGALFAVKEYYLLGLHKALPEPVSALAGGITVGDKRSLGAKLTDQFRRTGLVHIVVLSGYNITLIVGALMLFLRRLPLIPRTVAGSAAIIAFVLMTGASATGVRAGAMAILALFATATLRRYAIDRALALTAVGMVLWNPNVLLSDPGFQLSIMATLGLMHVSPFFEKRLRFLPSHFELRSIAAATLGTQISVLPLLVYQVGILSIVALPANLLVLPVIPVAMITSAIAAVAALLNNTLGLIAAVPAYTLLEYAIKMTALFAAVPFGAIELPAFSGWLVVAIYTFVVAVTLWYRSQSKTEAVR